MMVLYTLDVLVVQVEEEHQGQQPHLVDLRHNQEHMVQELIMEIEEDSIMYQVVDGHQLEEVVQVIMEQIHPPHIVVAEMEQSVYN